MLKNNVSEPRKNATARIDLVHARILFIHMVRKHEGILLKKFNDQGFLSKKIEGYVKVSKYAPLLVYYFGTRMNYLNKPVPKNEEFIQELVATLRQEKKYFVCKLSVLKIVLNALTKVKIPYEIDPLPTTASPKTKLADFINTDWWLLYKTKFLSGTLVHDDGSKDYNIVTTVTRAVIRFKNFGKAEVKFYNTLTNAVDTYQGAFEIFGDDDEYLSILAKKETTVKGKRPIQIQMTFHIGKENADFATGTFTDPQKVIEAKRGFAIKSINVPYQKLTPILLWDYFLKKRTPIFKAVAYYFKMQEALDAENRINLLTTTQKEFILQAGIPWWEDRSPGLATVKSATHIFNKSAPDDIWKTLL